MSEHLTKIPKLGIYSILISRPHGQVDAENVKMLVDSMILSQFRNKINNFMFK